METNKEILEKEMLAEYNKGWGKTAVMIMACAFTFVACLFFVVAVMHSVVMFLIDLVK